MINILINPILILGLSLMLGVFLLYYLRYVKPEIARDEDIFYGTFALIYSIIIIVHGWRLDPILVFSQALLIIIILVSSWENIRLRGLLLNITKLKKK